MTKKIIIKIKGLHCPSCKTLIEDVCMDIKGVKSCNVDVKKGTAEIEHDNVNMEIIKKEIESLGEYKVGGIQ